jgi:hypothetical protein
MFFTPAVRRAPMARLRQLVIARRVAGPQLGSVLGEGGVVVSRTWCRTSIFQ